jgi:hypothetical protein
MMAPLKAIEEITSSHRCYVATKGKRAESSFQYEFHLPGDLSLANCYSSNDSSGFQANVTMLHCVEKLLDGIIAYLIRQHSWVKRLAILRSAGRSRETLSESF